MKAMGAGVTPRRLTTVTPGEREMAPAAKRSAAVAATGVLGSAGTGTVRPNRTMVTQLTARKTARADPAGFP